MVMRPPILTGRPNPWVLGLTQSLCHLGQLICLLDFTHSSAMNQKFGSGAGSKTSARSSILSTNDHMAPHQPHLSCYLP